MKFKAISPILTARRCSQAIFDGKIFVYSAQWQNRKLFPGHAEINNVYYEKRHKWVTRCGTRDTSDKYLS